MLFARRVNRELLDERARLYLIWHVLQIQIALAYDSRDAARTNPAVLTDWPVNQARLDWVNKHRRELNLILVIVESADKLEPEQVRVATQAADKLYDMFQTALKKGYAQAA